MLWLPVNVSSLNLSLFLAFPLHSNVEAGRCWFVVVQHWRIPSQNGNLLAELASGTEESFFHCKMTWFALQWYSFAQTLGYCAWSSVHRCLFSTVLLRPLVGLRPPSKIALFFHFVSHSFSFILSFCLTMSAVSLPAAVPNTIPEGVLSQCWCHKRSDQPRSSQGYMAWCGCHERSDQSRSSQGYMAWCGCHEILIERGITVLFLSHFSLYPIRQWFWWWSYPSHSLQLISVQYSFHHSDPAKNISLAIINHWFRHPIDGRLAFRDTSPVAIRTKCMHLLHRLCSKSPSSAKSNALAVLEISQKALPNNSKYRSHETTTVTIIDIL